MTSGEINRSTLNRFLVRAIGHAAAVAIDAEFGLRVREVENTADNYVRIALDNDHVILIDVQHLAPRHRQPGEPAPMTAQQAEELSRRAT